MSAIARSPPDETVGKPPGKLFAEQGRPEVGILCRSRAVGADRDEAIGIDVPYPVGVLARMPAST